MELIGARGGSRQPLRVPRVQRHAARVCAGPPRHYCCLASGIVWDQCPRSRAGEATSLRHGGPVAQWSEPTAHNGLVGGSSPPGPTTHSFEPRDFPETSKRPAIGGLRRRRFGLRGDLFPPGGDFGQVVSGPRNPVSRKRRPSSAETRFECPYCAIKPSI